MQQIVLNFDRPLREDEVLPVRTHRIVDGAPPAIDEDTETRIKQKKRHRKDKSKEKKKDKDKKVCTTPALSPVLSDGKV